MANKKLKDLKSPAPAEHVIPVGSTGVRMLKPQGFVPAKGFEGFEQEQTSATILVQVQQMPAGAFLASVTASTSNYSGIHVVRREEVQAGMMPATLLEITQRAGKTLWHKWALVTGNDQEVVMVMATWPAEHDAELSNLLRRAVVSARWDGESKPGEPDFRLALSHGELKIAYSSTYALTYSTEGQFPCDKPDDPLLVACLSMPGAVPQLPFEELQGFAEGLLERRQGFHYTSILETIPLEIDGLPGFRSVASAIDMQTNAPVTMYQLVLFHTNTKPSESAYYLMLGTVGSDRWDSYFKSFDALSRSLRRT